ncbi:MAG: toxin-antitoxin system protein [Ktedonobacterales bacterium]
MPGSTVRISEHTHDLLKVLAAETGEPMQAILDRALEEYRRRRFLEEANAEFAALRNDPEAWQEELDEREAWDSTLMDGIESDESW